MEIITLGNTTIESHFAETCEEIIDPQKISIMRKLLVFALVALHHGTQMCSSFTPNQVLVHTRDRECPWTCPGRSSSSKNYHRFLDSLPINRRCSLRLSDNPMTVDEALQRRKSCKRFKRYDGTDRATGEASQSDPEIVRLAFEALNVSRRTPSAFNTQPYKVILVHSPKQKAALSKFSLGPNQGRVLDSDCTAVFLADRKVMLSFRTYRNFVAPMERNVLLRNLFYISIFSSGYPLPRFLAAPLSFLLRSLFGVVHFFTRAFYPMPSLSSAETWASKQTLMYAMSFLLACTSRGLATIPMEGLNASSIRRVLKIPSRYAIPLMVSVGRPYYESEPVESPRYDANDVIYSDTFLGKTPLLQQ